MAQEYTITKVSDEAPRPWKNGISYYKVRLEGHPRPVSIGKKSVPAVGNTVYGDITAGADYAKEDNFKSAQRPQFADNASQAPVRLETPGPAALTRSNEMNDGMAWGNALTNATSLVTTFAAQHNDLDSVVELTLTTAKRLYSGRDDKSVSAETTEAEKPKLIKPEALKKAQQSDDLPPVDLYDEEPIDLDEIEPF